jgi:hypothetical protein
MYLLYSTNSPVVHVFKAAHIVEESLNNALEGEQIVSDGRSDEQLIMNTKDAITLYIISFILMV